MNTPDTQKTIDRYFNLMGKGQNFAECYAPDVSWTMVASGTTVDGADRVRAYVEALHAGLVDSHTTRMAVGDGWVYLEGQGDDGSSPGALPYCVAYDLDNGQITAMRCYGTLPDVKDFKDVDGGEPACSMPPS